MKWVIMVIFLFFYLLSDRFHPSRLLAFLAHHFALSISLSSRLSLLSLLVVHLAAIPSLQRDSLSLVKKIDEGWSKCHPSIPSPEFLSHQSVPRRIQYGLRTPSSGHCLLGSRPCQLAGGTLRSRRLCRRRHGSLSLPLPRCGFHISCSPVPLHRQAQPFASSLVRCEELLGLLCTRIRRQGVAFHHIPTSAGQYPTQPERADRSAARGRPG